MHRKKTPGKRCLLLALATCALIFLVVPQSKADQITIGNSGVAIYLPFGVDETPQNNYQAGAIYQQIYSRRRFSGPVTITQVAFASASEIGMSGTAQYDFQLRLDTAARPIEKIPRTRFSENRGGHLTSVFSGQLTTTLTHSNTFDLIINLATPFIYDPRQGDLLLDIVFNKPTTYTGTDLYFVAGGSEDLASVYNNEASEEGTVDEEFRLALLTRFTTTPVVTVTPTPEPATMLLLGTGLAGIGGMIRSRRRRKIE